jgi:prepilin-type N-terminal cleavage/methylation domain-containing protein
MSIGTQRGLDGPAKTAGFTLVELLVVIAMTGVLMAIMLPALATAKERTRRAVCKGNQRQLLAALQMYGNENGQLLPSSADNKGYYHSIVMSDSTFTNLVGDYAAGESNIFYCPNIAFGSGTGAVAQHNPAFGYVIGYNYLVGSGVTSSTSPDPEVAQQKWPSVGTNELLADANYWTPANASIGYFPSQMKVAPHTVTGAAMTQGSSFTVGLSGGSSASIGAVGGNIAFSDCSVQWRTLPRMETNAASYPASDMGLW